MEVEKIEEVRKIVKYKVKCTDCDATTMYDYEPMSPWTCAKCTLLQNLEAAEKSEESARALIGGTITDMIISGNTMIELVVEQAGKKYRIELYEWQGDVEFDVYAEKEG